jgi:hypothetical protein
LEWDKLAGLNEIISVQLTDFEMRWNIKKNSAEELHCLRWLEAWAVTKQNSGK